MSTESKGRIICMKNGPYVFEGLQSIKKASGEIVAIKNKTAFCRCGESKNKPYCDGSHARVGFSDEKLSDRQPDRRDNYAGEEITIHDNRGICAHAGYCTDSLKSVFRIDKEPFVDPNGASKDEIINAIEKCPSGALNYAVADDERVFTVDSSSVLIAPNGPYAVQGKVSMEGAERSQGTLEEKFTLCRCGSSRNKPFCDGTHWKKHFDKDAPDPTT